MLVVAAPTHSNMTLLQFQCTKLGISRIPFGSRPEAYVDELPKGHAETGGACPGQIQRNAGMSVGLRCMPSVRG